MKTPKSYTEAMNELAEIARAMEDEEVSVDDLAEKVKRATILVQFCEEKLKDTDLAIKSIIASESSVKSKNNLAS